MANRFWGEAPIAQYSPTSMQEAMFGPETLYKRDQALSDEMDALNESKLSLQGVLGSAAGKQEEFDQAYKEAMDGIAQNGATRVNIDKAKKAKQLYAQHVLPMQEFAKQRQAYGAEYAKLIRDKENIVDGVNPLEKTFDEYMKDPNSLNSFQTVSRDKLASMGMLYGKEYADGIVEKRDYTDADLGIVNVIKGFKNAGDAFKAYASDPTFKSLIDAQVSEIAKGRGVNPNNPEVRSAITSGIMSGVVGKTERLPISAAVMKKMLGEDGSENVGSYIKMEPNTNINLSEGDLKEQANQDQGMKTLMDSEFNRLSKGKYPTYESWKSRNEKKSWTNPDDVYSMGKSAIEDMGLEGDVDEMLKTNPYFGTTQMLNVREDQISNLGETDAKKKFWEIQMKTKSTLENQMLSGQLVDKAYTSEGNDLLAKVRDGEVSIDWNDVKISGVGFQGISDGKSVSGTGKPVIMVVVDVKEPGTQGSKKMTIPLKPTDELLLQAMAGIQILYDDKNASKEDKLAINSAYSFYNKYRKSLNTKK